MNDINDFLSPGNFVRHPNHPEWGIGQVQSNIGGKVTVTFPETGKIVFDGSVVALDLVASPKG